MKSTPSNHSLFDISRECTRLLRWAALLSAGFALVVQAGQSSSPATPEKQPLLAKVQPAAKPAAKSEAQSAQAKKVLLTGSRIPQKVRRSGLTTDSANSVIIIDHAELGRNGATSVGDVLRRLPIR